MVVYFSGMTDYTRVVDTSNSEINDPDMFVVNYTLARYQVFKYFFNIHVYKIVIN